MSARTLAVGDKVIVTGDSHGWMHQFTEGTEGVIDGRDRGGYVGSGYLVRNPKAGAYESDEWDVHEDDLRPVEVTPDADPLDALRALADQWASEAAELCLRNEWDADSRHAIGYRLEHALAVRAITDSA